MNLDRVKQILKKVNALVENLDDQGQTSAIERDLLLRYLRDVYEDVSLSNVISDGLKQEVKAAVEIISEPKIEAVEEVKSAPIEPVQERPVVGVQDQTTYYDSSSRIDSERPIVEKQVQVESPLEEAVINTFENPKQYFPPAQEKEQVAAAESPKVEHEEPMASFSMTETIDQSRFDALFAEKSAADLKDRFQLNSISTIESAMGINERMQAINELFKGDHKQFMETVTHLNGLSDFDTAKTYMINGVADQFSWDSEEMAKMAREFVQLVRRKYV